MSSGNKKAGQLEAEGFRDIEKYAMDNEILSPHMPLFNGRL